MTLRNVWNPYEPEAESNTRPNPLRPTAAQRRAWQHIDDREVPSGSPDGVIENHVEWRMNADRLIDEGAIVYDKNQQRCRAQYEFEAARDQGLYPLSYYLPTRYPKPQIPSDREIAIIELLRKKLRGTPQTINITALAMQVRAMSGVKLDRTWLERFFGSAAVKGDNLIIDHKGIAELQRVSNNIYCASYIKD